MHGAHLICKVAPIELSCVVAERDEDGFDVRLGVPREPSGLRERHEDRTGAHAL
jgi:hypothetical protein